MCGVVGEGGIDLFMNHKAINELEKKLYACYRKCRIGKKSNEQIFFEQKLGMNIHNLACDLISGEYRPLPSKFFIVQRPKPREIFSAHFRDRIVHHFIVSELEKIYGAGLSDQSFACRTGRGQSGAFKTLDKKIKSISRGGRRDVWYLQLDVESFFASIDRNILTNLVLRKIDKNKNYSSLPGNVFFNLVRLVYLHDARIDVKVSAGSEICDIIPQAKSWFTKSPHKGIPIGNLTSQFGANLYLTDIDHFIRRKISPKAYLRYMDDLLILSDEKEDLLELNGLINERLMRTREINLHPKWL